MNLVVLWSYRLKTMKQICLVIFLIPLLTLSQVDFENYVPLESSGPIPAQFSMHLFDRLDLEMNKSYDLSRKEKKNMLQDVAFL